MKTLAVLIAALAVGCFLLGFAVAADPARYADSKVMYQAYQWGAWFYVLTGAEGACRPDKGWLDGYIQARDAPPMAACVRTVTVLHYHDATQFCSNVDDHLDLKRCWEVPSAKMRPVNISE